MLECKSLGKIYHVDGNDVHALSDINITLPTGSFTVLVGPSGCGKTTLLRAFAGLIEPTTGSIHRDIPPCSVISPSLQIGYVFQEPRLMPWLTVSQNIGFGLKNKTSKQDLNRRVADVLSMMGLERFAQARPDQLSGGMASRVGLARALVGNPDLLLLDEPFAALDAMTRRRLQGELTTIWMARKPTVVFVTHDVEEAVLLGDVVYRMHAGLITERYDINIPRPRDPTTEKITAMRRLILQGFENEEQPSLINK
ncbi:ABC transporter ATP-binding protein [Microvirga sp. W0021]|uniref:ABC transporter ATP-binding protein n=1 Tax=Hohaiivirga grylli TaxID=3133970 RepID=A0ABV0BLI5_9HYPH